MTIAQTIATIRAMGATCSRTEHGEFRVSLPGLPPARAEAIAGYPETADEAIALAASLTGQPAILVAWIPCTLTGAITYPHGRPAGAPVRFSVRTINATPDGSKMTARATFPAEAIAGRTAPAWSVSRTVNMPACLTESADHEAARVAIASGLQGADHVVTFDA